MRYMLVLFLLGGCATPEERADRIIARQGPFCERLGYPKDSDGWRDCVMQRDRQAREAIMKSQPARTPTNCTAVGMQTICN